MNEDTNPVDLTKPQPTTPPDDHQDVGDLHRLDVLERRLTKLTHRLDRHRDRLNWLDSRLDTTRTRVRQLSHPQPVRPVRALSNQAVMVLVWVALAWVMAVALVVAGPSFTRGEIDVVETLGVAFTIGGVWVTLLLRRR